MEKLGGTAGEKKIINKKNNDHEQAARTIIK